MRHVRERDKDASATPAGIISTRSVTEFIRTEAGSGLILVACAILALSWSNSRWSEHYFQLLHASVQVGAETFGLTMSLQHWINDALMVVFFLVVGLEIKREVLVGELASRDKAAIPAAAAIGGAIVPALLFLVINQDGGRAGWGIPMATDIAFALGVLALVAGSAPVGLRIFLMALAIVDDLLAVVVIAIFYTSSVRLDGLAIAGACLGTLIVMNRLQIRQPSLFFLIGIILWLGLLKSGVHATIAGVLIAMCVPVTSRRTHDDFFHEINEMIIKNANIEDENERREVVGYVEHEAERVSPPAQRLIHSLHPWVAFLIVPVFAIANAGVELGNASLTNAVSLGVLAGLVIGKPLGIILCVGLMLKLGLGELPQGMRFSHVPGLAALAGIGFTMSLFISDLAYEPETLIDQAKIGILASSLVAAAVGSILIRVTTQSSGAR